MNKNFFLISAGLLMSHTLLAMQTEVVHMPTLVLNVQKALCEVHGEVRGKSIIMSMADENGWTFLHDAAAHGRADLVKSLIPYGVRVNARTDEGATALHIAAHLGFPEVCKLLLDAGAFVDARADACVTPLILAALGGHWAVIKVLTAYGADVTAQTMRGKNAAVCARDNGHVLIADQLSKLIQAKKKGGKA